MGGEPVYEVDDDLLVGVVEVVVGLQALSLLDVEDGPDLLVGLEGEVLHFGGDEGVVVGEGEVVGLGLQEEGFEVVFGEDVVGFEEWLVQGQVGQLEPSVVLECLHKEAKVYVLTVYCALEGGLGLPEDLPPYAVTLWSDSEDAIEPSDDLVCLILVGMFEIR